MKGTNVAVLLADLFEDREFWYPYLRMKEAGLESVAIGAERTTYKGKHGTTAEADQAIAEVSADDFQAVVIPGGYSPDHMRREPKMVNFVRKVYENGGIAAAICHGPWMLASARIITDREVTCFHSIRDDVENAGARWVDREVVVDQRIITSRVPADLPAFCKTILQELESVA